jgi:hypothetical protein
MATSFSGGRRQITQREPLTIGKQLVNLITCGCEYLKEIKKHLFTVERPGWLNELGSYLTTHTSLSPIRRGFAPGFVNYKKGCTRLAAASDHAFTWYFFMIHFELKLEKAIYGLFRWLLTLVKELRTNHVSIII